MFVGSQDMPWVKNKIIVLIKLSLYNFLANFNKLF